MLTRPFAAILFAAATAAARAAAPDQKSVVGTWQCNPRAGKVWRMMFTPDRRLVLSLPADEHVDATTREAKFKFLMAGTWRIHKEHVVYTVEDRDSGIPKTTGRIELAHFKRAIPFGTERDPYLERLE